MQKGLLASLFGQLSIDNCFLIGKEKPEPEFSLFANLLGTVNSIYF